jgi:hypothetical protein
MYWATFWAIFSQAHTVALTMVDSTQFFPPFPFLYFKKLQRSYR